MLQLLDYFREVYDLIDEEDDDAYKIEIDGVVYNYGVSLSAPASECARVSVDGVLYAFNPDEIPYKTIERG